MSTITRSNAPVQRRHSLIQRMLMGSLLVAAASSSAAVAHAQQGRSVQRVQATPPVAGSTGWAQDNCFYTFQQGGWQRTDMCRVMLGSGVYDTFAPSTRRWLTRIDESKPGWIGFMELDKPGFWLYGTNDGARLYAVTNGQWIDLKAAAAQAVSPATTTAAQQIIARNQANPALQAQIAQARGVVAATNSHVGSVWTAPNCVSSSNGCR